MRTKRLPVYRQWNLPRGEAAGQESGIGCLRLAPGDPQPNTRDLAARVASEARKRAVDGYAKIATGEALKGQGIERRAALLEAELTPHLFERAILLVALPGHAPVDQAFRP